MIAVISDVHLGYEKCNREEGNNMKRGSTSTRAISKESPWWKRHTLRSTPRRCLK